MKGVLPKEFCEDAIKRYSEDDDWVEHMWTNYDNNLSKNTNVRRQKELLNKEFCPLQENEMDNNINIGRKNTIKHGGEDNEKIHYKTRQGGSRSCVDNCWNCSCFNHPFWRHKKERTHH